MPSTIYAVMTRNKKNNKKLTLQVKAHEFEP